jgi:hypothetical protein
VKGTQENILKPEKFDFLDVTKPGKPENVLRCENAIRIFKAFLFLFDT